jgi:Flp pilus assembly protein TadG
MIRKAHSEFRNERGSAAIEFALISPVFVILLIGVVELGFAGLGAMRVQDAAEAGALYAQVNGWDAAGIAAAVTNATGATGITATPAPVNFCGCPGADGITAADCAGECADGSAPGKYVTVSASMPRLSIMPETISTLPPALTAHSTVRIQ